MSLHSSRLKIEAHLRGLILEESDGDVAETGMQDNALGIVGGAARLSARRLGGGAGGRGRGSTFVVLVLAEH